ncbi:MAG: hypothetical protein M0R06_00610 [Sphaerochaeta sp.]|jgi:hypothetical protein|nr:hypothetical protein [Sphaerochaeta sp.]
MADGITIAGKERHFAFTNRARKEFKKLTGKAITDVSPSDEEVLAPICWAMLLTEDPELPYESVAKEIDDIPLSQLIKAINSAMKEADPLPSSPATS